MLEETYLKFKKNILPKMKKMQPNFQEPVVEYCEPEQVIDIDYVHTTTIQYLISRVKIKEIVMMIMIYTTHQNLNTSSNTEFMKMCSKLNN